jgi:hypothetical protein
MKNAQVITVMDKGVSITSGDRLQLQDRAANEDVIGVEARHLPGLARSIQTMTGYLLAVLLVFIGWKYRGNPYISPEDGPGYALGIIGGSIMVLLLLYPLRKHMRWMRSLGPVSFWFRAHMLMGIIGPVCILYHCNYQLGSANANIALFSMLLVAGSGLAGRYFYSKIHYGLYGKKADLARLNSDGALAMSSMQQILEASPGLYRGLQELEQQSVKPLHGILPGLLRALAVGIKARWYWIASGPVLRRTIENPGLTAGLNAHERRKLYRQTRYFLRGYLDTVCKIAGLALFERLFSLWHILHLPLFFMLLLSGTVHVFAVHMY